MHKNRQQGTLIMIHDPESTSAFAVQEHIVKREQTSKWIKAFRLQGFEIVRVTHNYKEGE